MTTNTNAAREAVERKSFEDWYTAGEPNNGFARCHGSDEYLLAPVRHAWQAWQARAALTTAAGAVKESLTAAHALPPGIARDDTVHGETYYTAEQVRAMLAQAAPVAQGDALTDTYVQQVPDKCDRIVWRGRYYHLPIDAAEHSYTEPSPMAKVAAALRQKAEQEDAAYQARRSDQGLMESEWGPMEDAPPHEDPPMHVAVVEGDDTVRTLQWNRDVAAFAYPAGTLLYAARPRSERRKDFS